MIECDDEVRDVAQLMKSTANQFLMVNSPM